MIIDEFYILKNLISKIKKDRNIAVEELLLAQAEDTHKISEVRGAILYKMEFISYLEELQDKLRDTGSSEESIANELFPEQEEETN